VLKYYQQTKRKGRKQMSIIDLTGKEVPKKFDKDYAMMVTPDANHRLDEDGFTNPKKPLEFRLIMDKLNHVYVLPLTTQLVNGELEDVPYYNLADIVAAASGNLEAQSKIDYYNNMLRESLNSDRVLTHDWNNQLISSVRDKFVKSFDKFKAARGQEQNAEEEVPFVATSYEDLTPSEVQTLASSARAPKSGAAIKYTPSEQGGNVQ
jgi:hypothetical protein